MHWWIRILRASWPARAARGAVLPALGLLLWEAGVAAGLVNGHLLPPPSTLAATLLDLVRQGSLWRHVGISTLRVAEGVVLGSSVAMVLGLAVGLSARMEAYVDPLLQGLRAIPSLAWVPLLLLWLGIDEAPKLALIAIGAFSPVYLNLVSGIRGVDRKLVELGRVHGLGTLALVRRILLPAALPQLFVGLRSGVSLGWMFLVAAELIAASEGLGYLLTDGRETGRADVVMVSIVILAVLGKLTDGLLQRLEAHQLHWRDVMMPAGTA